ncbi:NUDIX domain-containing protein [Salinarimonas soli]|uniref:GDP-mannose pyrophosphatase n=1 Tax=Salinarimonas soli TaxID=1638099 RepID=A0A5B2VPX4_9HYPH|nr:NUDIX hydrolase [Salinarimonas soli]KAA2241181.1 NUDIX hydrolase [Salinarimonas soli]
MSRITDCRETHRRWATMSVLTIEQGGGVEVQRDVEDHGNAAAVLAYDPERRVALLVRQCRAPPLLTAGEETFLELPAGRIESEDAASCARREVMEETGVRLATLAQVTTAWTMPALSTERAYLFLATYSATDRVAAGGGLEHEGEDIEVVELPLAQLASRIDAGEELDLKILFLVQTLRLRRPELFRRLVDAENDAV